MKQLSLDAVIMGIIIGISAVLIDLWFSQARWFVQLAVLVGVGILLSGIQYGLMRWLRRSTKT